MDNLIGKTLDGLYTVRELIGTGGTGRAFDSTTCCGGGLLQMRAGIAQIALDCFGVFAHLPRLVGKWGSAKCGTVY